MVKHAFLILFMVLICQSALAGKFAIDDVTAAPGGGFYVLVHYFEQPSILLGAGPDSAAHVPLRHRKQLVMRLDKNFQLVRDFGQRGVVKIDSKFLFSHISATSSGDIVLARDFYRKNVKDERLRPHGPTQTEMKDALEDAIESAYDLRGNEGVEEVVKSVFNPELVEGIGLLYLDGKSPIAKDDVRYFEHPLHSGDSLELSFSIQQSAFNPKTGGIDLLYSGESDSGKTYIVRIKPNGQLDAAFGTDGKVEILKPLQGTFGPITYVDGVLQFSNAENTDTGNVYQAIRVADNGKQTLVSQRKTEANGYPISVHYHSATGNFLSSESQDFDGLAGSIVVVPGNESKPTVEFFGNVIDSLYPTADGDVLTRESAKFSKEHGYEKPHSTILRLEPNGIQSQKVPGLLDCQAALEKLL